MHFLSLVSPLIRFFGISQFIIYVCYKIYIISKLKLIVIKQLAVYNDKIKENKEKNVYIIFYCPTGLTFSHFRFAINQFCFGNLLAVFPMHIDMLAIKSI